MTEDVDHARVLIAPPLAFSGYLAAALLLHWAIPLPLPWLHSLREVAALLILAGLLLAGYSISLMARAHTSPDPRRSTTALVMAGPYSRSRNPIYLGLLIIYLGFTAFAGTIWGVLLSPFLIVTINRAAIQAEESYSHSKFDSRYSDYKSRVRQWL